MNTTIALDRIESSSSHPTDFFAVKGYRSLAASVLEQALSDATCNPEEGRSKQERADRAAFKESAREWLSVDDDRPGGAVAKGLTFSDCVQALGLASSVRQLRQACVDRPEQVRHEIRRLSATLIGESIGSHDAKRARFDYEILSADWIPGARVESQPQVSA